MVVVRPNPLGDIKVPRGSSTYENLNSVTRFERIPVQKRWSTTLNLPWFRDIRVVCSVPDRVLSKNHTHLTGPTIVNIIPM